MVLLLIILVVFGVTQTARFLTGGDESDSGQPSTSQLTLPDYAGLDSQVRLTYTGPIVAREDFLQIRMSVSASGRSLAIIDGYGGQVQKRQRLSNDPAAYGHFLRALYLNNFSAVQDNELGDDERGVCFKGQRIVGQLLEDDEQILRLWAASCGRELGTMNALWRDILKLFQDQFPDYRQFTR